MALTLMSQPLIARLPLRASPTIAAASSGCSLSWYGLVSWQQSRVLRRALHLRIVLARGSAKTTHARAFVATAFAISLGLNVASARSSRRGGRIRRHLVADSHHETSHADLSALSRARLPLPPGISLSNPGDAVGLAYFWTFLYMGPGRPVVALRNLVEHHADGRLEYVKLAVRPASERHCGNERLDSGTSGFARERVEPQMGQGYGQWCRLTAAAEERIISKYKSVADVLGKAQDVGVTTKHSSLQELAAAHLLTGSSAAVPHSACLDIPTLDYPVYSDEDIVSFEDVQDRLPFGVERKMHIHMRTLTESVGLEQDIVPDMRRLPFGLPASCDAWRGSPFTGSSHGFGIVPHINEQQFVSSSGCENAWVRFDKGNLQTYDHNLDKVPVFEDGDGILFPVTHLWVDLSFPTADCAMEWFCGRQCVARKMFSLWPVPNPVVKRLMNWAVGKLQSK